MESTSFEVRAVVKYVPMSPRKVRLVINQSAIANAEENFGLSREDLYISQIFADVGPTHKRWKAGARGRAKPILKRSSHITVVLEEMEVGS